MSIILRPHQNELVTKTRYALSLHKSVLLYAAPGAGKTVMAAYMARGVQDKGKRAIFACHRDAILNQTAKTFDQFGIDYGYIAAGYPESDKSVYVASIDTLRKRVTETDILVVDEAHGAGARTWDETIQRYRDSGAYIIGLSGSPCRLDGKPLRSAFECMVMGPQPRWLIDNGYLSEYRAYAAKRYDLSGLHTRDGDYVQAELDERFNRPSIIGDAVDTWVKFASGLRTVVYAFSIKHSHAVVEAFNAAGIPAAHMDGNTPKKEQRRIIEAFADGGIKVLSSVEILTTGFDLSAQVGRDVPIEAVSLLRPTQSLALAVQMMGRGLRYKPYPAVILDHAGVIATHGLPCQDREWSLDGHVASKKAGYGVTATCICQECFAVFRPSYQCPFCNAVREIDGRKIDIKEGELAEVDIMAARQAEIDVQTEIERKAARRKQGMAQTLESMADIAASKGYAVGWLMKVCPTKKIKVDWRSANMALSEAKRRMENG